MPDEPVLDDPLLGDRVSVGFVLTRDDVASLGRFLRPGELRVVGVCLAVAAVVVGVLALVGVWTPVVVAVGVVAVVALGLIVLGVARARRRSAGREMTLAFSPSGVEFAWDGQAGSLPWEGLELRSFEDLVVLVRGRRPVVAVPSRCLADEERARIAAWGERPVDGGDAGIGSPDAVSETADSAIVVSGVVTASRAREGRQGMIRPWVRRLFGALSAAVLVAEWGRALLEERHRRASSSS